MIDSHCHIDFDELAADRAAVLQRAVAAGVTRLVIPSVHPNHWQRAKSFIAICEEAGIKASVAIGLHPWWADQFPVDALPSLLDQHLPDAIAVGECGLDALRDIPMALQIEVLQCHIAAAKRFDLPLILHCVKAHDTLLSILKAASLETGGVVHGFGGSLEIAEQYTRLGFHIGVGGMVTRPHATRAQRAFRALPLEALVLETDAPAMPLWNQYSQAMERTNEPANVARIAAALAELRGDDLDKVIRKTEQNTRALFTKMR